MSVTEKTWSITLNSDCECYDCLACEVGVVGADSNQKCDECEGALTNADTCFGCWDDSERSFYEALAEWRKEVGVTWDLVKIEATGMGWDKRSGHAVVKFDEALRPLTLRGDFRIEAKWEGKTFSARRYSHDEPMGSAVFSFTLVKEEDEDE